MHIPGLSQSAPLPDALHSLPFPLNDEIRVTCPSTEDPTSTHDTTSTEDSTSTHDIPDLGHNLY
eukprot:353214-Chlamydomonas_euryale.AAC.3